MTVSVFFSLSALFLKKLRNIVWVNLYPSPHVLEYLHRLLSFSNILPKFYPRWIEFYGGWNLMGFLKILKQAVRDIENIWKYTLRWTRYLISIFIASFNLYVHALATSLEKRKTNFPRLYSWSCLCCHYGICSIFLHHRTFLSRNTEISVRWFLLTSLLKQKWAQVCQGKRKQGVGRETTLLKTLS